MKEWIDCAVWGSVKGRMDCAAWVGPREGVHVLRKRDRVGDVTVLDGRMVVGRCEVQIRRRHLERRIVQRRAAAHEHRPVAAVLGDTEAHVPVFCHRIVLPVVVDHRAGAQLAVDGDTLGEVRRDGRREHLGYVPHPHTVMRTRRSDTACARNTVWRRVHGVLYEEPRVQGQVRRVQMRGAPSE